MTAIAQEILFVATTIVGEYMEEVYMETHGTQKLIVVFVSQHLFIFLHGTVEFLKF